MFETPRKRVHDTGLVTEQGDKIIRLEPPKPAIGFVYDESWLHYDLGAEYLCTNSEIEELEDDEEHGD